MKPVPERRDLVVVVAGAPSTQSCLQLASDVPKARLISSPQNISLLDLLPLISGSPSRVIAA